jgi:agmatinase
VVDGRGFKLQGYENGFFVGGTLFDHVKPDMKIYREEIFGPVLSVVRAGLPGRRRPDPRPRIRQRHRHLHPRRRRRARVRRQDRSRHGRHQRADPGAGGLSLVRRLEALDLRQRLHDQLSTATPRVIDSAITRPSPYGTSAEPTYSGITSFLRRPYSKDLRGADVAVFGAPFDLATTNRSGARLGPRAIRIASASLAWCPPYRWGFDPLDRLSVVDYGDLYFDPGRPADIPQGLYDQVRDILSHAVLPLALGGDHFVSFPILRALSERHGPIALIHFDAHSDTWRDEDDRIDHGTMFFHAARLGYVDPLASIQLGMRTFNEETHGFRSAMPNGCMHKASIGRCMQSIRGLDNAPAT